MLHLVEHLLEEESRLSAEDKAKIPRVVLSSIEEDEDDEAPNAAPFPQAAAAAAPPALPSVAYREALVDFIQKEAKLTKLDMEEMLYTILLARYNDTVKPSGELSDIQSKLWRVNMVKAINLNSGAGITLPWKRVSDMALLQRQMPTKKAIELGERHKKALRDYLLRKIPMMVSQAEKFTVFDEESDSITDRHLQEFLGTIYEQSVREREFGDEDVESDSDNDEVEEV